VFGDEGKGGEGAEQETPPLFLVLARRGKKKTAWNDMNLNEKSARLLPWPKPKKEREEKNERRAATSVPGSELGGEKETGQLSGEREGATQKEQEQRLCVFPKLGKKGKREKKKGGGKGRLSYQRDYGPLRTLTHKKGRGKGRKEGT